MDNSNNDDMLNPESGKTDEELRPIDEQDSRSASKAMPSSIIEPPKRRDNRPLFLEKAAQEDSTENPFANPEPFEPQLNPAIQSLIFTSIGATPEQEANSTAPDKAESKQEQRINRDTQKPKEAKTKARTETKTASETSPVAAKSAKNNTKMGIIGPGDSGKTYLFNALVHLTRDTRKSGALSSYLDNKAVILQGAESFNGTRSEIIQQDHSSAFMTWQRLEPTLDDKQKWYWLTLPYRRGLGLVKKQLEVEFLDAAGETLSRNLFAEEKRLYQNAYLDADIMVFCLPLWVAFPVNNLEEKDCNKRKNILNAFHKVVNNFRILHNEAPHSQLNKVRSILALTMADDTRCGLTDLRDNWISPYMDRANRRRYNKTLLKPSGVACYLANARRVSQLLAEEFEDAPTEVSDIPNQLNFGQGQPWLIPISAIDGDMLEVAKNNKPVHEPYPVHVELTLLVTLCASENALM